jgi:ureidoacrylate peracid hydrolase
VLLPAKPEPVEVDLAKCALMVVDMQNAFATPGGMLDIAGVDIADAPRVVEAVRVLIEAGRAMGMPIVYLQAGYKSDLSDGGGPDSPNPRKELALRLMCSRPELKGKLLVEGTWDHAIVDQLTPRSGDLVIPKTRYSGFAGTTLDAELKSRGIRYLFFTGIAANVCVESTLRDAFFLDYWPLLIADATMAAGPAFAREATLFNVESFFGWIVESKDLLAADERR